MSTIFAVLYAIREASKHRRTVAIIRYSAGVPRILNFLIAEHFILGYSFKQKRNTLNCVIRLKYGANSYPALSVVRPVSKQLYQFPISLENLQRLNITRTGLYVLYTEYGLLSDRVACAKGIGGRLIVFLS